MKKTITAVAMDLLSAEVQASFWRLQCKPCLGKVEFHNTRGLLLPHEQTENVGEGKGVGLWKKRKSIFPGREEVVFCFKDWNSLSIFFRMGNFYAFCREEKKLTEKEIGEVIVIRFFLVAYEFCDTSYIYIIDLLWQEM